MSKNTDSNEYNLFSTNDEESNEGKTTPKNIPTTIPLKLGKYDRYEVVSTLRKEIKLGNKENACYWTALILNQGGRGGRGYLLRQLWIMCAEDLWSTECSNYCASITQMEKDFYLKETDHFYGLVCRMCDAPKFWETLEGRQMDYFWAKAEGQLEKQSKEIPSYGLDQHTRRGLAIKKQTGKLDDRFSGSDIGRQKTVYLYKRDGFLSPEKDVDENFIIHLKKYNAMYKDGVEDSISLDEYLSGHVRGEEQK